MTGDRFEKLARNILDSVDNMKMARKEPSLCAAIAEALRAEAARAEKQLKVLKKISDIMVHEINETPLTVFYSRLEHAMGLANKALRESEQGDGGGK